MQGHNSDSIPIIDMSDFPNQSQNLIEACEEWGCFRIEKYDNRVLNESLMHEMNQVGRFLLELPIEVKMRNEDVTPGSGYMAPSHMLPLFESLGIYGMTAQDVETFCSKLDADPQQRATIQKYVQAMNEIMLEIANKIAQGLGVNCLAFEDWSHQFRINKYNFTHETVGSLGVILHTDSSFLTILQLDDAVGGLEVMSKSGDFVPVDPCPGTLFVNLGDIATAWSNGRLFNMKHRVMCKKADVRISIGSFLLGPKEGSNVEAPLVFVDEKDRPRLYVPFTYREYRSLRVSKRFHAGEALDSFRFQY